MGMSVFTQCDSNKYFALSTISRKKMDEYGIKCTMQELRNRAKNSPPVAQIVTGQSRNLGYRKMTKIYQYKDFVEVHDEHQRNADGHHG